jgi:hypothetical protein
MLKKTWIAGVTTFLMFAIAPKMSAQLNVTSGTALTSEQPAILADYLSSKKKSRSSDGSFQHSVGGGLLYGNGALAYIFSYYPRFVIGTNFSIGAPIGLGLSYNSRVGGSFGLELPLTADFNFGSRAAGNSGDSFGGFIGAGVGYGIVASSESNSGASGFGLVGHGGLQFNYNGANYYARVAYLYNLKVAAESIISLTAGLNF